MEQKITCNRFSIKVQTEMSPAALTFTEVPQTTNDVYLFRVHIAFDEPTVPEEIQLSIKLPAVDCFAAWQPFLRSDSTSRLWHGITPNWRPVVSRSRSASGAPVLAFYGKSGNNRLTVALSDASNSTQIGGGVSETSAELRLTVKLLDSVNPYMQTYDATIRLDLRDLPLVDALHDVSQWWEIDCGYTRAPVPENARLPMYSTWYSYHQHLSQNALLDECRLAKDLGMDTVLLDDGWQCENSVGGYAYCGDWEVATGKFPDFAKFVADLHAIGMKTIVWYSVPFMGFSAKRHAEFEGKCLYRNDRLKADILDPRYPEVRACLVETYVQALRRYDLDGFKLDFIDSFKLMPETPLRANGMDFLSLEDAVQALLAEIMENLRAIKPDIMIEFRQNYIGPVMSSYGNIFRVGDCPYSALQNRVDTVSLRMLSGKTAVHTDMVMWHGAESAERAAHQILQAFFAVPQISVRLAEQSPRVLAMLRHYLALFRKYQSVLLDGKLTVSAPDAAFPLVSAERDGVCVATVLDGNVVFRTPADLHELVLINAGGADAVYAEFNTVPAAKAEIFDCTGAFVGTAELSRLCRIEIPDSGMARIVFA